MQIDLQQIFATVKQEYLAKYGTVTVIKCTIEWSAIPRYRDGRISTTIKSEEFGGCYTTAGIIYINPRFADAYKYYTGRTLAERDTLKFLKALIAHEYAHGIYDHANVAFRKKILAQAQTDGFTTAYLKSYKTPPEAEVFCEYMSASICQN